MMTYYLLRLGGAVSRVAPLSLLYAVASLLAYAGYLLPTVARAAVRGNIARAMGRPTRSKAVRRAAREAFRCQALNYVDLMRVDRVTARELDASVVRGDLAPFVAAVAAGRGVIIVSAHVGNMDYVAQWLALQGYRVHAAMERLQPERLFALVRRQRESAGLRMHPLGPETVGVLTEALRRGEVVALIADRDITDNGITVDFLGAPARLPAGPALLALRTGAPIMAAFGRRLHDDRLYVSVRQPVHLARTRSLRHDLQQGVQTVAHLLEEGIRRTPEQWIVFEPLWKEGTACA